MKRLCSCVLWCNPLFNLVIITPLITHFISNNAKFKFTRQQATPEIYTLLQLLKLYWIEKKKVQLYIEKLRFTMVIWVIQLLATVKQRWWGSKKMKQKKTVHTLYVMNDDVRVSLCKIHMWYKVPVMRCDVNTQICADRRAQGKRVYLTPYHTFALKNHKMNL